MLSVYSNIRLRIERQLGFSFFFLCVINRLRCSANRCKLVNSRIDDKTLHPQRRKNKNKGRQPYSGVSAVNLVLLLLCYGLSLTNTARSPMGWVLPGMSFCNAKTNHTVSECGTERTSLGASVIIRDSRRPGRCHVFPRDTCGTRRAVCDLPPELAALPAEFHWWYRGPVQDIPRL